MIIDTHAHVWSEEHSRSEGAAGKTSKYPTVEELSRNMNEAGVDKAVIVRPTGEVRGNEYVAECLRRFPGKFAAIALVDAKSPDAPDELERLVREQGFGGTRLFPSREADLSVLAARAQDPLWRRAEELGVCFIVLVSAEDLSALEPIIERFPNVKVVIDHLGRVPVDEAPPQPLLGNLLRLARFPAVYVKVSAIGDRSKSPYPHKDTFSTISRIHDAFGPQRLMWGTNYPGGARANGYAAILELVRTHMDFLTEEDKEWLLSKTAMSMWRFDGGAAR